MKFIEDDHEPLLAIDFNKLASNRNTGNFGIKGSKSDVSSVIERTRKENVMKKNMKIDADVGRVPAFITYEIPNY